MARIRTIKPEMWADEKLSVLEPIHRLVFPGLISMADDKGRLVDSVKQVDAFIFARTRDSAEISLEILHFIGLIERGQTESGQDVIQIVNWEKHQKVNHVNDKAALNPIHTHRERPARMPQERRKSGSRKAQEALPHHIYYQLPTTNDLLPTTNYQLPELLKSSGVVLDPSLSPRDQRTGEPITLLPPTEEDFRVRNEARALLGLPPSAPIGIVP